MHALIDADIFLYSFGSAKGEDGEPAPWPFIISRMDAQINNILEAVGATSHQLYVTGPGNFREEVATIKPYKGQRPSEKPYWHEHLKAFLLEHRDAYLAVGVEADDWLGIEQYSHLIENRVSLGNKPDQPYLPDPGFVYPKEDATVICSQDKDLDMIPGWHYSWPVGNRPAKELWWQDETSAIRSFYSQLLTGDSVDNIPGLFGVGKSSTLVKRLSDLDSEYDMYVSVRQEYEKRFGSYWKQFLIENARLLWILREEGEDVADRLDKLEEQYNESIL